MDSLGGFVKNGLDYDDNVENFSVILDDFVDEYERGKWENSWEVLKDF